MTITHKKILLIDENMSISSFFVDVFSKKGFTIEISNNIEDGLCKSSSEQFLAIIIDLPHQQSLRTFDHFYKNKIFRNQNVILFSGIEFGQSYISKLQKYGLYGYVKKPAPINYLLDLLNTIDLSNKQQESIPSLDPTDYVSEQPPDTISSSITDSHPSEVVPTDTIDSQSSIKNEIEELKTEIEELKLEEQESIPSLDPTDYVSEQPPDTISSSITDSHPSEVVPTDTIDSQSSIKNEIEELKTEIEELKLEEQESIPSLDPTDYVSEQPPDTISSSITDSHPSEVVPTDTIDSQSSIKNEIEELKTEIEELKLEKMKIEIKELKDARKKTNKNNKRLVKS